MDVLSVAYFPPLSYFSLLIRGGILLEACENYQKQSWRNRCRILTANGVEELQVPVLHTDGTFRHPIRETMIDWSGNWLVRHKRAIDSAYMSSAYFEYYRDGLYAVLDRKPESLWDLDRSIIDYFLGLCGCPATGCPDESGHIPVGITKDFSGNCIDIHPKHRDCVWESLSGSGEAPLNIPYFQVFSNKFGFVPNLSVMDYIFNEGPIR